MALGLLSNELVKFSSQIPPRLKIRGGERKISCEINVLRLVASKLVVADPVHSILETIFPFDCIKFLMTVNIIDTRVYNPITFFK